MDIATLQRLAGIHEFKGYTEYTVENMSQTATELKKKERELNIKPGDKEWFELWFSKPYMTGHTFRGRKKG
ncbi:uncharacterized protein METZ01_LOCUS509593 [marine metagenome]|uniref:Uncharacterized protein n=1 Tax=marine metagenome TaxID=408172 RepID=A0A383EJB7_9ZZZZ|tara:strand:+ start:1769 stop:1981 length:213 start_codon:yes stop_codon:yes gene_type:complete